MSEYQYYEFQAIDRQLTVKEMAELRSYSTRARITATSFINDYSPQSRQKSASGLKSFPPGRKTTYSLSL
jgi:hypothetical protein